MEIIFFPKSQYPVSVCNHRYGKGMTFTEQSDESKQDAIDQVLALSYPEMRFGCFVGKHAVGTLNIEELTYLQAIDKLRCDYYFPPKHPSDKTILYSEEEFNNIYTDAVEWFMGFTNRIPSSISYGYGIFNYADFVKSKFLSARNSGEQTTLNSYGLAYNKSFIGAPNKAYNNTLTEVGEWMNRRSTYRLWNQATSVGIEQALYIISNSIDNAYQNSGWFTNFSHWRDMLSSEITFNNLYKPYFDLIKSKTYYNDIHFCSWGEAVEYMVFREMIKNVAMCKNGIKDELIIAIDVDNKFNINTDLLYTPISLEINLTGTILEGKNVLIKGGTIINTGENIYIVEINYKRINSCILYTDQL